MIDRCICSESPATDFETAYIFGVKRPRQHVVQLYHVFVTGDSRPTVDDSHLPSFPPSRTFYRDRPLHTTQNPASVCLGEETVPAATEVLNLLRISARHAGKGAHAIVLYLSLSRYVSSARLPGMLSLYAGVASQPKKMSYYF